MVCLSLLTLQRRQKGNTMKSKLVFLMMGLFLLFSTETAKANSISDRVKIALFSNLLDSEEPVDPDRGHRSISMPIPVSAFMNDTHIIELDFDQPIGEVEILISQDGETIYSSSENIISPISKDVLLPQELSGRFLLEIRGENGTYIYGYFSID